MSKELSENEMDFIKEMLTLVKIRLAKDELSPEQVVHSLETFLEISKDAITKINRELN